MGWRTIKTLILIYLIGAFASFSLNGFDLTRDTERRPSGWCELREEQAQDLIGDQEFNCVESADSRTGGSFDWISWSFFSDGKGHDTVGYIPADVTFLLIALAGWKVITSNKSADSKDTADSNTVTSDKQKTYS